MLKNPVLRNCPHPIYGSLFDLDFFLRMCESVCFKDPFNTHSKAVVLNTVTAGSHSASNTRLVWKNKMANFLRYLTCNCKILTCDPTGKHFMKTSI